MKIKLSKLDTRSSENSTELFSKRIKEDFKVEFSKIENWEHEDVILPKRISQNEKNKL